MTVLEWVCAVVGAYCLGLWCPPLGIAFAVGAVLYELRRGR